MSANVFAVHSYTLLEKQASQSWHTNRSGGLIKLSYLTALLTLAFPKTLFTLHSPSLQFSLSNSMCFFSTVQLYIGNQKRNEGAAAKPRDLGFNSSRDELLRVDM